jgi:hypothetical protein
MAIPFRISFADGINSFRARPHIGKTGVGKIHNHRFFASVHSGSCGLFSGFTTPPHSCYKPFMKEPIRSPSGTSQSLLGYLCAFTLGIICMGAIMYFMRARPATQPAETQSGTAFEPASESAARPNAFASRTPNSHSHSATAADEFPIHDISATDETTALAADQGANSNQSLPVTINRHVSAVVVADRHLAEVLDDTRVSGRTILLGPRPQERIIPMDPQCAAKHPGPVTTRFFVTGKDNGLADVFVVITAGLPEKQWPVPQEPVTLRLRNCIYENHVVGVQSGQQLLVANLDNGLHNVHPIPSVKGNPESNFAMLPKAPPLEFNYSQSERFLRFKCDVHPWEFAYVNVVNHPFFAITDADGNFSIEGLPPGEYRLEAHHRKAGIIEKQITVQRHRNTTLKFEFTAAPPPLQEI